MAQRNLLITLVLFLVGLSYILGYYTPRNTEKQTKQAATLPVPTSFTPPLVFTNPVIESTNVTYVVSGMVASLNLSKKLNTITLKSKTGQLLGPYTLDNPLIREKGKRQLKNGDISLLKVGQHVGVNLRYEYQSGGTNRTYISYILIK